MTLPAIPARMTYDDCARIAVQAQKRHRRHARARERILAAQGTRSVHGPYAGASTSRILQDWTTLLRAADEEVKRDGAKLRGRGREIYRNNPLGRQYGRLCDLNIVGADGPKHRPRIRDNSGKLSKLNAPVKEGFAEWSEVAALNGKDSLVAMQHQLAPSSRIEGEMLVRKWTGPQVDNDFGIALEAIDPDQLDHTYNIDRGDDSNVVSMGIEYDRHRKPVAYHIYDDPFSYARQRKRVRIDAREIIHVFDPNRANQGRGVTDFHAVMMSLHLLGAYAEYALIAARTHAAKPIIWKRIQGDTIGTMTEAPKDANGNTIRPIEDLEPGMFGFAPEGYEPADVHIEYPSIEFESFIGVHERYVSSGLGVGLAALTGDLSKTSFSSARTGTLLERDTWRTMQSWWCREFMQPVYRAWLREAILIGGETGGRKGLVLDSRDFRRLYASVFIPRGYDYVNPLQDANAVIALITHGLWSRHRAADELQLDIEDLFDELQLEDQMAAKRGITIVDPAAAAAAVTAALAADAEAQRVAAEEANQKEAA